MTHTSCPNGKWINAIKVKCDQGQIHEIVCCDRCLCTTSHGGIDDRYKCLKEAGKNPTWHADFLKFALTNTHAASILRPYVGNLDKARAKILTESTTATA